MLKILLITLGANKPSTRLRILPLTRVLRARGHAVSLADVLPSLAGRLRLLSAATEHDVVLLQKKLFPSAFVSLLRKANPRLVFDVDDAVMFHELERGQVVTGRYFHRFASIAAASRTVVAGNAYVADFARAARCADEDGHVFELPTPIDTTNLSAKRTDGDNGSFIVGWIGTKGNLHQLLPLADALRAVQECVPDFRLRIVADATPDLPGLRIEFKPWRADEEVADLHGFDVGIMPLRDSLWNRGKGGYKLLQYMAAGLPAIASPVGINSEIVQHGENGFLAKDPTDWRNHLLTLANQPELRKRIGHAARKTVEQHYSLKRYLDRYVGIIESCVT
jgi:glycosyltransferase involved in cell wall biosynthesis